MKRYMNDPSHEAESQSPRDMRDTRPLWKRLLMIFRGYYPF